jgi:hypothetical protein
MTIITIMLLIKSQTTVFYILYLFWCDEFIRTIFDRFRYKFKKNQIEDLPQFLSNNKDRFFMLWIYFVFIIVFFGLVIDWKNSEIIGTNFSVFLFKNSFFNYSIITFLLREIYLFRNDKNILEPKNLVSNGIIILHISLIFGILFWFLSTKKFLFFQEYATLISIIPFLLLKIIFELKSENQMNSIKK